MIPDACRRRFGRVWHAARRRVRTALRRHPLRRDPLASLVETARSLDYGSGSLPKPPGGLPKPRGDADGPPGGEGGASRPRGAGS